MPTLRYRLVGVRRRLYVLELALRGAEQEHGKEVFRSFMWLAGSLYADFADLEREVLDALQVRALTPEAA